MRVVVAPNPLKGSLSAPAAAAAIARGVRSVFADAEVVEVPVADGGEGTLDALLAAAGGERRTADVEGPLGGHVTAAHGLLPDGTAVVELASSSGLTLVDRPDPRRASTYGFGQLIGAALGGRPRRLIAGVGGSATNDGGAGMAQALGWRLLDATGAQIERGGAALASLRRIERPARHLPQIEVLVAADVTNPLCGPQGASFVYGPQKGATPEVAAELDSALQNLANVVARDLGVLVGDLPGAGAAGGAAAGLVAFLGARIERGAPLVAEAAGLEAALRGADLVLTAEGRVDVQTAYGKGPAEVARLARAAGAPVVLLAGGLGEGWESVLEAGVDAVEPMATGAARLEDMLRDAERLLESAAARACRLIAIWRR